MSPAGTMAVLGHSASPCGKSRAHPARASGPTTVGHETRSGAVAPVGGKLRTLFRGYYRPTADELNDIWATGELIFDTNALLNLFRYTDETRDDFLGALRARREDLWIPHQVGQEFHERWLDVVHQTHKAFDDVVTVLEGARKSAATLRSRFNTHPSLDANRIAALIDQSIDGALAEVESARSRQESYQSGKVDGIFSEVSDLFNGRVGSPYEPKRLEELYKLGESRYEKKFPPGYMDTGKDGKREYGDFLLWMQILDHAEQTGRPAIFVTQDAKEDWWRRSRGETYGPRPELVAEYFERAGALVHFYDPKRFLKYAKSAGVSVSTSSLSEVERVSALESRLLEALLERRDLLTAKRGDLRSRLPRLQQRRISAASDEERRMELESRLAEIEDTITYLERRLEDGYTQSSSEALKDVYRERHSLVETLNILKQTNFAFTANQEASMVNEIMAIDSELAQLSATIHDIARDDNGRQQES